MGATRDETKEGNATKQDLQKYQVIHERIHQVDISNTYNAVDPNHRLVFIAFDGTRNDRNSPDPDNIHTNPDLLQGMVLQSDTVASIYVPGVATRNENLIEHYHEAITGDGCEAKAGAAYKKLALQVQEWHAENPNIEVHLSTVGFSRGTGSQRHFANLVADRGIPDPDGEGYLFPPGGIQQDVMLLYDSVVTGQEDELDLGIPQGVVAVHFTADHDNRINFDSASIVDPSYRNDPGILEVGLPGAHSDIGGSYDYNGLSARTLALGHELLSMMGVPINEIPIEYHPDPDNTTIHESGSIFNPGNWEFGEREVDIYGNPERLADSEGIDAAEEGRKEEQGVEATEVAMSPEKNVAESAERDEVVRHQQEVEAGQKVRAADLELLQAQNGLSEAISSGDGLAIIQTGLEYYSRLEDRADLGLNGHDGEGGFLSGAEEALLDSITTAIGLGRAIDNGDGWGVAGESVNLLREIDNYLAESGSEYSTIISDKGSALLGVGASGIGLAQAIETGNDWGIAQSSVGLVEGIDSYFTPISENGKAVASVLDDAFNADAGSAGTALSGAGSAVGLAMNISQIDDVFESGDIGAIAFTTASTFNNAINTYNAAASLMGASNVCISTIPGLAYVGAAIQLIQGDVVGAAISAATAALMMCGPYGWIAAAALQIGSMLFGDDEPPEASASFTVDADGGVAMEIDGDSAMRGTAEAYGRPMVALMESYRENGGRLLIDGSLPTLRVVQGENSAIEYRSDTGGRTSVVVDDLSQAMKEMSAALYARDRGERLNSAIETVGDVHGDIDLGKVDAIMAGHGFVKNGMTYTYGETGSRAAASWGSGIMHGGGNVGPEGRLITAKAENFTSLPLRPEQLPRQQLGEIIRHVGLNTLFTGAGSELVAMALGFSDGLLSLAASAHTEQVTTESNSEYVKPLDGAGRDNYLRNPTETAQPERAGGIKYTEVSIPEITDLVEMQHFLTQYWSNPLGTSWIWPEISADGAFHYRDTSGYGSLLSCGSGVSWRKEKETEPFYRPPAQQAEIDNGYPADGVASYAGRVVASEDVERYLPPEVGLPPPLPPPGVEQGVAFVMAEDSVLRFLPVQLTENTLSAGYSMMAESFSFVSFGEVSNGRVWLEKNGDIRFAPTPGFVGTGSFVYTLQTPGGELVERLATVLVHNVNDFPVLSDDTFSLPEGEIFYLDRLLANDRDPDGDTLLLDHFRGIEHGEVAVTNGQLAFVPEQGYHGDIEFSYWIRDHVNSYPVMALATLTYTDVNKGPVVGDDRFIVIEETPLVTSVDKILANDIEHDGEVVTFVDLGSAVHGMVGMQADGSILFMPAVDYAGTEAGFSYHVQDGSGHITTGWVAVEVLDRREAPVVLGGARGQIQEDEILTFSPEEIRTFVYDPDGDALHLERITNVTGGTVVVHNGYYAFVPHAEYSGLASFDFLVSDNHQGTVEGHLELDVTPANDAIDTGIDVLSTVEEQLVTTSITELLANDRDADGSVVTFVTFGESAHGTVAVDDNGTIAFTPEVDYCGEDAGFLYIVEDSEGLASVGQARVLVAGVNDAPVVVGETLGLQEDRQLTFDAATLARFIRDVDGDTLTVTMVEAAEGGVVSKDGTLFTFTPRADYHGAGSVRVTVVDGDGASLTSILTLDVNSVNDPTVFPANLLITGEEQSVTTTTTELLAGSLDADGTLEFLRLGRALHGSVSMAADGEITFVPDVDYFGDGAGFEYLVRDPDGHEAMGSVAIQVENVDDTPLVIAKTLNSPEDHPIVFDAATVSRFISDLDGDTITLTEITEVSGGTISKTAGVYTFTPTSNYHGPASVTYSATDGHGTALTGVVNLDILSQDDPTDFGVDSFTLKEEQLLVTNVAELLAGDSDPDGNGQLEFVGLGAARYGQVRMFSAGIVEFLPDTNYFGEEAGFAYRVGDSEGTEDTGWVTVKITNVNDAPEIIGNRVHIREDQRLCFTTEEVAGFITDADGDLLNLEMVSAVTGGRMELSGGVYTFIPDQDFYGEASFAYLAGNSQGEEVQGQVFLGVSPVNDLPGSSYIAATGLEDREITLLVSTLMAGASDVEDGAELRFGGIANSLHGDVYVDPQDTIHFLPDQDFSGSAFFRYRVLDSEGGVGYGYVGIEVIGENDAPVAIDDAKILAWSNNYYENIYMAEAFLGNDFDADIDPLQIVSVGPAEFGAVSVDGAGNIHYLAEADGWVGIDTFSYSVSDGNGGFSTAKAAIDVKINTSPDVFSELLFTREDIISNLAQQDVLANDMDIDGDTLRVIAVDQAEHCQVELLADGSIRFVPELNFNNHYPEQASFRYAATDGISDPVTAIAFFDIDPINDAPILRGERIAGAVEDNSFAFAVTHLLANDSDVELASPYEEDAISFAGVWGAGHGSITYDPHTETVYYAPVANFYGDDTFSYRVVDAYGAESVIGSLITVQPVNDYPVVQDDIGEAEDSVWNYYSIGNLVGNDFDVDGDALTLLNPRVLGGRAEVGISSGNLMVKPEFRENRVVVGYTVSDGHGGQVNSQLSIDRIREHNFAPTFSGLYGIGWKNSYTVWFNFHADDKNGGNTWGESGDIASISASAPNVGEITDEGYTFKYKGDTENASVVLTAVDQAGATGSIYVRISELSTVDGYYIYSPVVLDLDGDGVELLDVSAGVEFAWNLDGNPNATGWVGGDDGFLVYDYDRNRVVTQAGELALKDYNPGATTDLEGLRAFDSNKNGVFDAADKEWAAFGVWQDKNSNGKTDNDSQEFATLDERGIAAINLESDNNFQEVEGNIVHGMTAYQRVDGTVGEAADVGLLGQSLAMVEVSAEEAGVLAGDTESADGSLENLQDDAGDPAVAAAETDGPSIVDSGDDSLASTESAADQATEIEVEPCFDDAEINRLSNQLLSDIAAYSGDEIDAGVVLPDVSDCHGDLPDPLNLTDHEYFMIV